MSSKLLKYLLDIESIIEEIESIKQRTQNSYFNFSADVILIRAAERDLEIIGEALRKIIELYPNIQIANHRKIIGLRNIISHAYDSVEPEMLWGIIQKNIPVLADEIRRLKE